MLPDEPSQPPLIGAKTSPVPDDLAGLAGRRILVTGAAGFVGFHATRRLLNLNATVLGVDNLSPYYSVDLKRSRLTHLTPRNRFSFEEADIAAPGELADLHAEFAPDAVLHLAAQAGVRYSLEDPHAYAQANLVGFLNVLEAVRRHPVRHLVYASSSSVYGANRQTPFSEHAGADHPVSLYAATKRANELMAHSYSHLFGIPASALRFFTVYGPWGRPDMAYYSFTKAILEGRAIDVFNHGRLQRDFTYIDDVVEGIVRLIGKPPAADAAYDMVRADPSGSFAPHRIYNIGNNQPVSIDRFIAAIEDACGRKAERHLLPMQPGDVPATFAQVDDLAAVAGFAPHTSIEDGIARFVAWYRAYHAA